MEAMFMNGGRHGGTPSNPSSEPIRSSQRNHHSSEPDVSSQRQMNHSSSIIGRPRIREFSLTNEHILVPEMIFRPTDLGMNQAGHSLTCDTHSLTCASFNTYLHRVTKEKNALAERLRNAEAARKRFDDELKRYATENVT